MSQVDLLSADLAAYLKTHGFERVAGAESSTIGVEAEAFENGEFRVRVVRERGTDSYVEVGPCGERGFFLSGVVAFLTNDDTLTRISGQHATWLSEHHKRLALVFGTGPDSESELRAYREWVLAFGQREQRRLEEAAAHRRAERTREPWWKLW